MDLVLQSPSTTQDDKKQMLGRQTDDVSRFLQGGLKIAATAIDCAYLQNT